MIEVKWKRKGYEFGIVSDGKRIHYYLRVPQKKLKKLLKKVTGATEIYCDDYKADADNIDELLKEFWKGFREYVSGIGPASKEFTKRLREVGLE